LLVELSPDFKSPAAPKVEPHAERIIEYERRFYTKLMLVSGRSFELKNICRQSRIAVVAIRKSTFYPQYFAEWPRQSCPRKISLNFEYRCCAIQLIVLPQYEKLFVQPLFVILKRQQEIGIAQVERSS